MAKAYLEWFYEIAGVLLNLQKKLAEMEERGLQLAKAIINGEQVIVHEPLVKKQCLVRAAAIVNERLAIYAVNEKGRWLFVDYVDFTGTHKIFSLPVHDEPFVPLLVNDKIFVVYREAENKWCLKGWYCTDPIVTAETPERLANLLEELKKRHCTRCDISCSGKYCAPLENVIAAIREMQYDVREWTYEQNSRPIELRDGHRQVKVFSASGGIYAIWS